MPHPNNHTTFYVDERVMYEDLQSHYVQATVIAIHEDVGGAYYTIITDDATTEKQTVGRRLQKLSNFTDPDTVNAVEVIREVIREKEKLYNETCYKAEQLRTEIMLLKDTSRTLEAVRECSKHQKKH